MNSLQSVGSLRSCVRKSLNQLPKNQFRNASEHPTTRSAETVDKTIKIVVPKRIERKPTDILKALSSTVTRDYLAPDFKYHDDPFLIPTSNVSKRMYALSQESGRKAAQWIRQEHADLFQHRVADPPIEPYFPKAVYNADSDVDEDVLKKLIKQQLVADSLTVYGLLEEKGVELSRTTKQSLLELVCYYNEQDPLEEDWIEERWFRQDSGGKERKINSWKDGGSAQRLFDSLSPPDAASYAALICGMVQAGNYVGAYKRYQEALDQGLLLPLHVYNKLITCAPVLKEAHNLRWQHVEDMLGSIKQQGLSPDLGTLNAVLEVLSSMNTSRIAKSSALAVMAEFRNLGVEPSLASYHFLLNIFCKGSNTRSAIIIDILNILEGKSLTMQDPRDVFFFTEAMDNCRFHLGNLEAAYRLDKLLHTGDNYNLIGDSYKESVYYRNFFALVCEMGTMNEFIELYNKLVPNIYVPEPGIMELAIKTVELNEAWELLPRMWSDLVMFEQTYRESLLLAMLAALQHSSVSEPQLLEKLADVAWDIYTRVDRQQDREDSRAIRNRISWTGQMLGDIIQVLLRANKFEQALEILNCLEKRQNEILGVPSIQSLFDFLDKCIERNDIQNAIRCIQYCYDAGFEDTAKMAQKLSNAVEISGNDYDRLVSIVGREALEKQIASAS